MIGLAVVASGGCEVLASTLQSKRQAAAASQVGGDLDLRLTRPVQQRQHSSSDYMQVSRPGPQATALKPMRRPPGERCCLLFCTAASRARGTSTGVQLRTHILCASAPGYVCQRAFALQLDCDRLPRHAGQTHGCLQLVLCCSVLWLLAPP